MLWLPLQFGMFCQLSYTHICVGRLSALAMYQLYGTLQFLWLMALSWGARILTVAQFLY
jgi:hypothetical protein